MTSRPQAEEPADDWPLVDFLLRLRTDQAEGRLRPLRDYLAEFAADELEIAREYVLARGEAGGDDAREQIGGFELLGELGRGGEGTVHLARDPLLDRQVALKLLARHSDDLAEARTLRAAAMAARLDHPALARVLGAGRHAGRLWIAANFVAGHSLADELERRRARGEPFAARGLGALLAPIARGLQHAHDRGVIHRDVKPGNLILRPDGGLVLCDFGLARDGSDARDLTVSGELRGTPAYMAPEQLQDGAHGPLVDVYALGVVAAEAALLQQPFRSASAAATMARVAHVAIWSTPGFRALPRDLRAVLATATAKDPAHRYASAAELAADLERLAAGAPVFARSPGTARRLVGWARHNRALAASLAALAASLVSGFIALTGSFVRERTLREQAQASADRTRAVAKAILFDRARALGTETSLATRVHLVREAAEALDSLAADAPADRQLGREECLAWLRLGELHALGSGPSLGDVATGLACYARAESIARERLGDDPRTVALLATIGVRRAALLDDPQQAAAAYRDLVAQTPPRDREARTARGAALAALAELARDDGDLVAARSSIEAAQAEFRADRDDPDSRHDLLAATITAATITALDGDAEVAEQMLLAEAAHFAGNGDATAAAATRRLHPHFERTLGNVLAMQGKTTAAAEHFAAAVAGARALLADDGTDCGAARLLADVLRARAAARTFAGDTAAAHADEAESAALASRFGFAAQQRIDEAARRPGR